MSNRHPSVQAGIDRLIVNPKLPPDIQEMSQWYLDLGTKLLDRLPDDTNLTDALRKLWESKNCVVYLAVISRQ
jgi:hypothetical protein